jgi:hypothetical protein
VGQAKKVTHGDGCQMRRPVTSCVRLAWVTLIGALLSALIAIPASANPGLTVTNAVILATVAPGQTLTQKMAVSIAAADPAADMSVQVAGLNQFPNGGYELLDASHDTSEYSARQFVTVDKTSFHLDPGVPQELTATVQVPPDVGAGGRYAMIHIATKPAAGAGVSMLAAVDVPVYLTIKDSQLIHTGNITGLSTGDVASGQPVDITTGFQSTGNHHFKVKGEVTVRNAQGQTLDTISIPLTASSVLPGMLRELKAAFIPQGELAPGSYAISSRVMLEDGSLLDEASSTFEVKAPYVPPPAMGSVKLVPSSASTLKTEDGAISISFPQGAAVVAVDVSLRDYPAEQLPAPPPGVKLTATCFRVDGLTGLLAKEATVAVKYTPADLAEADGDAARLKLARWDEANAPWAVLKTRVDVGTMTLSASSNQMSIWAVVVAAPAAAGAGRLGPAAIGTGVVVLALAGVFLSGRTRRRRKPAK